MKLHRLALVVVLLFVSGIVSTAAGEASLSANPDEVGPSEGSSCPDPGEDGSPCGPTCPCACCPGHWVAAAFAGIPLSVGFPPCAEFEILLLADLHPKDIPYRIFHPPRA